MNDNNRVVILPLSFQWPYVLGDLCNHSKENTVLENRMFFLNAVLGINFVNKIPVCDNGWKAMPIIHLTFWGALLGQ